MLRWVLLTLVVGFSLAAGCQIIGGLDGLEFETARGGGETTSSGGGGGATSTGGGPACANARWPQRPEETGGGGSGDVGDIVVAVRSVDFGEESLEGGPAVGLDLDDRCTCYGDDPTCAVPDWVDASSTADYCDGPQGQDNALARMIAQLQPFDLGLSSEAFSADAELGRWSVIGRIRDYDGQPDDPHVRVALYTGGPIDTCNVGTAPNWDGTDRWPVSSRSLGLDTGGAGGNVGGAGGAQGGAGVGGSAGAAGAGGVAGTGGTGGTGGADVCELVAGRYDVDRPVYQDAAAYVSGGLLVASLPELELSLGRLPLGGYLQFRLRDAVLVGRLVLDEASRWALTEGTLAGRLSEQDLLLTIAHLANSQPARVCTDNGLYGLLKGPACAMADSTPSNLPTARCTDFSLGLSFEAEPARLGPAFADDPPDNPCAPEEDPELDTCDAAQ